METDSFTADKRKNSEIPVIGLTGSSGSGKSTAAKILKRLGACVIDADAIAREAVSDCFVLEKLRSEFSNDFFNENGIFDRQKTAAVVFKDSEKLTRLTEITHEYIIREVYSRVTLIQEAVQSRRQGFTDKQLIVIDAPVPVEKGFLDSVDEVWVVVSDQANRIDRIKGRDSLTEEQVLSRFSAQMPDGDYIKLASRVLENNQDINALEAKIYECLECFLAIYGVSN